MMGLTSLYAEVQKLRKSVALHDEALSKMFKEKKVVDKRSKALQGMIERRVEKKIAREET